MRKVLLLLFLLGQLPALASQIVVGLRSDKLISWGVWEREGTTLEHYLLLYNKSSQPLNLVIREWNSEAASPARCAVSKLKSLYRSKLPTKQLVRLRYPKLRANGFMEYLEDNASVGVLPSNTDRPDAAVLRGEAYRYYTNEGANSGGLRYCYWLAFNALDAPPAQVRLVATPAAFSWSGPRRRGEESYSLAKAYGSYEAAPRHSGTLDSLVAAGPDPTIGRVDSAHQTVLVPAGVRFLPAQLPVLVLTIERTERFFRYNEQRQQVLGQSVSGATYLLPFFPPLPH